MRSSSPFSAEVERWRPLVNQLAGDLPVNFLLAWIQRESDGNPCSYTKYGEAGIFQLMPPDNITTAGTTLSALRAGCAGGTQSQFRQLSAAERYEQVRSGVQYVNHMRTIAHDKLDAAGVRWPESSKDFWAVVKLQHAYPAPTSRWLAGAQQQLGHPPRSWAELRSTIDGYEAYLNNAEWVGSFGGGRRTGTLIAWAGLATIAYLAIKT